jgi:hypothetical protein
VSRYLHHSAFASLQRPPAQPNLGLALSFSRTILPRPWPAYRLPSRGAFFSFLLRIPSVHWRLSPLFVSSDSFFFTRVGRGKLFRPLRSPLHLHLGTPPPWPSSFSIAFAWALQGGPGFDPIVGASPSVFRVSSSPSQPHQMLPVEIVDPRADQSRP